MGALSLKQRVKGAPGTSPACSSPADICSSTITFSRDLNRFLCFVPAWKVGTQEGTGKELEQSLRVWGCPEPPEVTQGEAEAGSSAD